MRHAFTAIDAADPRYPESVVEYICQDFLVRSGRVPQVYEELLNLAYWARGFAPHNIMEIGIAGGTFFVLSRFATGKKVAVDVNDARPKIHELMFGHDWCFLHGDSQTAEMQARVRSYCDSFDLILIDGDHTLDGVKRDFENYRGLLSNRGHILFHDVDPDHVFKGFQGGDVWRFWSELEIGSKTMLCCSRSQGRTACYGKTTHFGGIGIWRPHQ